jgi:glycosyltransferase involved in cell wall biosynthesis
MTSSPVITVVTPTKNRLALLRETIISVQLQSLAEWELIVVDDGSDDGTPEAMAVITAGDARIRYLQRKGTIAGGNVCRNQGVAAVNSALLVFLDSDDLLTPECLANRVRLMQQNTSLDFAVFPAHVFQNTPGDLQRLFNQTTLGSDLDRFLSLDHPWQTTGPVWRTASFNKIGGFTDSLLSWQDVDLHVRAIAAGLLYLKFHTPDHFIRWESNESRTSAKHFIDPSYLRRAAAVPLQFCKVLEDQNLLTWSRKRFLAGMAFSVSENQARIGRLGEAFATWTSQRKCGLLEPRIYWQGLAALATRWLAPSAGGYASRLVAKWQGWVRFRQNPSLLTPKAALKP